MIENPERIADYMLLSDVELNDRKRRAKIFANACMVGAASELIVCADLLVKRWSVFRSVSPASPFDLVAASGQHLLRIEVRTGKKQLNGKFGAGEHGNYDILAVVVGNEVQYRPEMPTVENL